MTSGPQRHGPKRMRNIAVPRLGDDCPFLELPPEVRNRIYEYALGGHNLHMFMWDWDTGEKRVNWAFGNRVYNKVVGTRSFYDRYGQLVQVPDYHTFRPQYVLCQCPGSDNETYQKSLKMPDDYNENGFQIRKGPVGLDEFRRMPPSFDIKSYEQRHEKCFDVDVLKYATVGMRKLLTTPRLAMGLLRTCKQVYNEAALVPFYDNTFSFARGTDVDFFVNYILTEKQRAAVQHITYANMQEETRKNGGHAARDYLKTHFHDHQLLTGLEPHTIDKLSGLTKLTITVDVDSVNSYSARSELWRDLPRFVRKDLKVEVVLRKGGHYDGRQLRLARGYAEELEFGLARSADDVPSYHAAREQLEYAQMQAAHLDHSKGVVDAFMTSEGYTVS